MTATYDGRLAVTKTGIAACCRDIDICVLRGQIYTGTKGQLMLRMTDNPRKGMTIKSCPFCGATPEDHP